MKKSLISGLVMAMIMSMELQGSSSLTPIVSKRPKLRPQNLNTTVVKPGELVNGKTQVSISFRDAHFYQRNKKEQIIPILDYIKNEYPNLNLAELRIKKIMVVTQGNSNLNALSFLNDRHQEISSHFVPAMADPSIVFGEFSQIVLSDYEMNGSFAYMAVAGAIWINNIIVDLELGSPNFNLNALPLEGRNVGSLQGVLKNRFNEHLYTNRYNEMIGFDDSNFNDQFFNNNFNDINVTPAPRHTYRTVNLPKSRKQSKVVIRVTRGNAYLKGFDVVFPNGSHKFFAADLQFSSRKKSSTYNFNTAFNNAEVTVIFENVSEGTKINVKVRKQ